MLTLREVIRERSLVFAGAPHDVYAGLLVTLDLEIPQSHGCTQQGHAAARHDTFLDRGASGVQSILHAGLLFLHFGLGRLNQGALNPRAFKAKCTQEGTCPCETKFSNQRSPRIATIQPATPPTAASSTLSMSSCLTMRARPAPMAMRIEEP
jgi:hypothetical protein